MEKTNPAISLRAFEPGDAPALQALLDDAEVSRHLTSRVAYPYTLEDATWWVETGCHANPTWAIVAQETVVGCIGLEPGALDEAHSAEVGYWIGRRFWGRGYATRALAQVSEEALGGGAFRRLTAGVFHPNTASMHVLEKCGYEREGVLRRAYCKNGEYFDRHCYARLTPA